MSSGSLTCNEVGSKNEQTKEYIDHFIESELRGETDDIQQSSPLTPRLDAARRIA